jgi:GT2 family glycosyltransferase
MFKPVKVADIELSQAVETLDGFDGYDSLLGLVRLHGTPVGYVRAGFERGRLTAAALNKAIFDQNHKAIARHLLADGLSMPRPDRLCFQDLLNTSHPVYSGSHPAVTIAVCSRDRAPDLARCLDSISRIDYPALDVLVIDNAPSSDATRQLVRNSYPAVRYVREPRPGLDWARNRAISEARGEIIAYTDDDVVVDAGWVKALASVFAQNPDVMAVTGLVVPYEIETQAQALFEQYGGFGRGFERKWYRVATENGVRVALEHGGAGKFGTGANMAYRRSLFDRIGPFDTALDVGTVTNGGGDLEMFFRVLKEGYTLVYEPEAIVRHRHRRDYAELRKQITNNGIGLYSYFVRSALAYKDERSAFIRRGLFWFWQWSVRRLLRSYARPSGFPRELIVAELRGSLVGLGRYRKSKRAAAGIARTFDSTQRTS